MIVFNGGLMIEQVEKLKLGKPIIYDKVPYEKSYSPRKNTFDYAPRELYGGPLEVFKKYVSEDCYAKQYMFLAPQLITSLGFCVNNTKRNYIMVGDVEEAILNNYIAVGNYDDYRIEYRVPRKFITPDKIIEFLYFEPYGDEQILEFKEKYGYYYAPGPEVDELARKLMLEKKLVFNGEKR